MTLSPELCGKSQLARMIPDMEKQIDKFIVSCEFPEQVAPCNRTEYLSLSGVKDTSNQGYDSQTRFQAIVPSHY